MKTKWALLKRGSIILLALAITFAFMPSPVGLTAFATDEEEVVLEEEPTVVPDDGTVDKEVPPVEESESDVVTVTKEVKTGDDAVVEPESEVAEGEKGESKSSSVKEAADGSSPEKAIEISLSTAVNGTISENYGAVWYKFQATSTESSYQINLTNTGSVATTFQLYNSTGESDWTDTRTQVAPSQKGHYSEPLTSNSWYCIKVENNSYSAPASFTLSVVRTSIKTIDLGKEYTSQKCPSGSTVWYKFKTSKYNSFYSIFLDNGDGGIVNLEWLAYEIGHWHLTDSVSSFDYIWTDLQKFERDTWYYISVEAPKSAANYSICVYEERDTGGDTLASSTSIGLKTQYGWLEYTYGAEDEDWFKVTIPQNGDYKFNFYWSVPSGYLYFTLYNKDGDKIDSHSWRCWDDGEDYDYFSNLKKGTVFYIQVHGNTSAESSTYYELGFSYVKKANPLTVKGKTVKVKYSKLRKKTQTIARTKAITVSKNQGTVTYAKVKGNKKITVDKKTGKIKVKKGLKKGTYKVKIKVTAAGNSWYKKATKTVTVKIKVK